MKVPAICYKATRAMSQKNHRNVFPSNFTTKFQTFLFRTGLNNCILHRNINYIFIEILCASELFYKTPNIKSYPLPYAFSSLTYNFILQVYIDTIEHTEPCYDFVITKFTSCYNYKCMNVKYLPCFFFNKSIQQYVR